MPGLFDRIKDTWVAASPTLLTTLSTFAVTGTAPGGYQTFSARYTISDANIPVAIVSQTSTDWMTCWCTYTASNTLRIDTIMFSSNGDAGVTFPAGTMDIFVTPASRAIPGLREVNTFTANNTFSGNLGFGIAPAANRLTIKSTVSGLNNTHWLAQDNGDLAAIFADGSDNAWFRLWDGAGTEQFRLRSGGDTFLNATGGNVGIGTTSPVSRLDLGSIVHGTASTGVTVALWNSAGSVFGIGVSAGQLNYIAGTTTTNSHVWHTNGAERVRIDANGVLMVNTTALGGLTGLGSFSYKAALNGDVMLGTLGRNVATSRSIGVFTTDDPVSDDRARITFTTVAGASSSNSRILFSTNSYGVSGGERMRIDEIGNVGIGTTAPKTRLQATAATTLNSPVLGSATSAPFYVTNSDTAYGLLVGTTAGTGDVWLQAQRTDGTATAYNINLNPAGGRVGIGTTTPGATLELRNPSGAADLRLTSVNTLYANIYASATDFSLMAVQSTPLVLGTANVQRVTIDASGNVGVGTISPSAALHLERNQASETSLFINNTNASGYSALRFGPPDRATNLDALIYSGIAATGIRAGSRPLLFESGNGTERMRMDVNGNFGIGTASPSSYDAKLAVFNGNIALTTTQNKLYLYYFSGTNHAHISTDTGGQVTISNGTGGVAERVRINTDGRVGMGRPPDHALDVQSSTGSTVIRGLSANSPTTILSEVRQDTGYNPAFLTMRRINIAGSATPSSVSIGEIRWDGSTTASVYNAFAAIRCDISTNSVNGAAAAIVFGTAAGAAANDVADKVWFHANGGVSIGQAGSPGAGCLRLGRFNNSSEGAELQFCRAIDNEVGWYIDLNGAGTGTDPTTMRFVDARSAAVRLELATRGVLRIVNDLGPSGSADDLALGFRGSPNNDRSSAYTLALTDAGRTIRKTSGTAFTVTIPASDTFPLGTCIILCNVVDNLTTTGGVLSVTGASGGSSIVLYNGSAKTVKAPGTLANIAYGGSATLRKVNTNLWVITGAGVS